MVQHQKQVGCREGRKIGYKYPDFTELKKVTSRIYSKQTIRIISSSFFKSF